jgi:hypothetical protein
MVLSHSTLLAACRCAPSRASLLTGREVYHVLDDGAYGDVFVPPGEQAGSKRTSAAVTRGMTMLPRKLQTVGYITHQVGKVRPVCHVVCHPPILRSPEHYVADHPVAVLVHGAQWHLGMVMDWQTPMQRGFNSSFGFLGGGEDHFTQWGMLQEWGCAGID